MDPRPSSENANRSPDPGVEAATLAVHGGREPGPGPVVTPVVQSTTFVQPGLDGDVRFTYSRADNPTVAALERGLAAFEGVPHALAFGSGMAAVTTLALTVLRPGDRLVCSRVVYGGIERLAREVLAPLGTEVDFVDTTRVEALEEALERPARLVFVETPANPTLVLTDLRAAADLAHRREALLAVDNTFLTAALQRPAELGADLVLYSTTKFVEGHNGAIGGAVALADDELVERLRRVRKTLGTIQAPWDAWLTSRGLKTLPLRMERHAANARAVAEGIEGHRRILRVGHPDLQSFPQWELARRQQRAGGGVLWFEVEGGREAVDRLFAALRICLPAESLGSVETLVTHPATMTHGDLTPARRASVGITDGLVRLSVGLESPQAILEDLTRALERIGGPT